MNDAEYRARMDSVCAQARAAGLDGVLICPSEELLFLTGFTPMMCERFQGLFLKNDGHAFYLCNLLYRGEITHAFGDRMKIYSWTDGESMTDAARAALCENGLDGCRLGVNSSARAFNVLDIAEACGVTFVNALGVLEEARIIKAPREIEMLRKAAAIADAAYAAVMEYIKPGMSEAGVRQFLAAHMTAAGGARCGGSVASGPNASYPHYAGSDRIIQEKDVVLMDFGCTIEGMHSDISRTLFIGGVSEEERTIYDLTLKANLAGERAAVNGAFIPDVDAAARDIIAAAGYGDKFIYRLGHGIGYMVHEGPDIKKNNRRRLMPGMAFSVEPGIYLEGRTGVRIEDIVVVTEAGNEVLNKAAKELIII